MALSFPSVSWLSKRPGGGTVNRLDTLEEKEVDIIALESPRDNPMGDTSVDQ